MFNRMIGRMNLLQRLPHHQRWLIIVDYVSTKPVVILNFVCDINELLRKFLNYLTKWALQKIHVPKVWSFRKKEHDTKKYRKLRLHSSLA